MNGQKEVGMVNGWRYVILQRERKGFYWVYRRSLSQDDHGEREEVVDYCPTEKKALEAARRHMTRVSKAVATYRGEPAPITYTNK